MNKTAAVTGKKFTTQRLALMAMFAAILCISAYTPTPAVQAMAEPSTDTG